MKILPYTKIEVVAPATYRVWQHPGIYLGLTPAIMIALSSTVMLAPEHEYSRLALCWLIAAATAVVIAQFPHRRFGKPALELADDILSVRAPARIEKIPLAGLRSVTITGPRGNRDWVFDFKDGTKRDFRPHLLRGIDEALVTILREAGAGRFEVTVEAPLFLEL